MGFFARFFKPTNGISSGYIKCCTRCLFSPPLFVSFSGLWFLVCRPSSSLFKQSHGPTCQDSFTQFEFNLISHLIIFLHPSLSFVSNKPPSNQDLFCPLIQIIPPLFSLIIKFVFFKYFALGTWKSSQLFNTCVSILQSNIIVYLKFTVFFKGILIVFYC